MARRSLRADYRRPVRDRAYACDRRRSGAMDSARQRELTARSCAGHPQRPRRGHRRRALAGHSRQRDGDVHRAQARPADRRRPRSLRNDQRARARARRAALVGDARGSMLAWATQRSALPEVLRRPLHNVHKGSFGTLAIVGGGDGMVGAAILAGRAALHLGAGKVWLGLCASARLRRSTGFNPSSCCVPHARCSMPRRTRW